MDFLEVFQPKVNREFTDYIVLTRRIGLPLLASVVCFLRMTLPDLTRVFTFPVTVSNSKVLAVLASVCLIATTFLTLLLIRVILGLVIFKMANYYVVRHKKYQDQIIKSIANTTSTTSTATAVASPQPKSKLTMKLESVAASSSRNSFPNIRTPSPTPGPEDDFSSPCSSIHTSFLRGSPNTEPSTINPKTRAHLYDADEKIPPTIEERRNKQLMKGPFNKLEQDNGDEGLSKVMRYKMASKKIW